MFGPTVAEIWGQYAPWGEVNLSSWRAVKLPAWRRHLEPAFGCLPWADVTPVALDKYVRQRLTEPVLGTHRGKRLTAPATVNNEISALKALFTWAVKRRLIDHSPLAGYEVLPMEDSRDFFVPEADFLGLLANSPPIARWFLVLAFETGMRMGEMRLLEPHEIDWQARIIHLEPSRTKGRKGRRRSKDIPLSELAMEILRDARDRYELTRRLAVGKTIRFLFHSERHPEAAISKSALWRWLDAARKKTGIKGPRGQAVWWHSLRKSFASIMAGEGHAKSIYVLMDILGHTSKASHDKYTRLTPAHRDALREAVDARREQPGVASAAEILRLVRTEKG